MDNLEIDYKKAAQQLRSCEALFGKDGALAPMLERILNAALEGEMDAHLNSSDRSSGNRRNGKMSKTVQTKYGEVTVETPRDRDGSFKPETVKKRETILAEGMADQIINMYALGTKGFSGTDDNAKVSITYNGEKYNQASSGSKKDNANAIGGNVKASIADGNISIDFNIYSIYSLGNASMTGHFGSKVTIVE